MNNNALQDIQKALEIVRQDLAQADAETHLAALQLMLGASSGIVALAKKISEPRSKSKASKRAPPPKSANTQPPPRPLTTADTAKRSDPSLAPIQPQPALGNQQPRQ